MVPDPTVPAHPLKIGGETIWIAKVYIDKDSAGGVNNAVRCPIPVVLGLPASQDRVVADFAWLRDSSLLRSDRVVHG